MTNIGDVIRQIETAVNDIHVPPTSQEREALNRILLSVYARVSDAKESNPGFFCPSCLRSNEVFLWRIEAAYRELRENEPLKPEPNPRMVNNICNDCGNSRHVLRN